MLINFNKAPDDTYFVAIVGEDFDREGAREMAISIMDYSRENKIDRLMIDLRSARNVDSVSDKFFFVHEDFREIQINDALQVAFLVNYMDTSHDFIETVMRNTGHNVLSFYEEKKAIAWLRG